MLFLKTQISSVNPTDPNGNGRRRTDIRFVGRTMADAHINEAAAPKKMVLRVIRLSWWEIGNGAVT
jgi:hypothetical protein